MVRSRSYDYAMCKKPYQFRKCCNLIGTASILAARTSTSINSDQTRYDLVLELLDPIYENELNIIEEDTRNNTKTCCRKMFSKWLNTDKLASWNKVIARN